MVADTIRKEILSGHYPRDTQIPTLDDLNERFSCSNGVTQPALDLLESEGFVIRRQGIGNFSNYGPETSRLAAQLHTLRTELSQIRDSAESALAQVNALIEQHPAAP